MITSKKVFIAEDTFVAFIDRQHPKHVQASAFFRYFAQEKYQLYSNIIAIDHAYNELYRNIAPSVAKDLLRALQISSFNLLYPEEADIQNSIKILINTQSGELTFAKALMAVLCNKRSIPQICTFEYLHALYGLQVFYLPI